MAQKYILEISHIVIKIKEMFYIEKCNSENFSVVLQCMTDRLLDFSIIDYLFITFH